MVPLTVILGDEALEEGTEISARSVAAALQRRRPVTTSRPAPDEFAAAYRTAVEAGADAVVSLHLSAEFSGTYEAACLAAAETHRCPVRVVDTGMVAMALGFSVLAAARGRRVGRHGRRGGGRRRRSAPQATSAYFYVDTLDYLRRGGRIGAAQALLGSALAVKPLLQLAGGRIELLEKVRTASQGDRPAGGDRRRPGGRRPGGRRRPPPRRAGTRRGARRAAARPDPRTGRPAPVSEVGAVIGAHTGPGLLGAVVSPR